MFDRIFLFCLFFITPPHHTHGQPHAVFGGEQLNLPVFSGTDRIDVKDTPKERVGGGGVGWGWRMGQVQSETDG